ncbi:MAG: twin-arginine translocase TatA/TatE family subunit [Opitutales bacterium]|nr:twin-arginine translocase TatA/TatE family subunit [Opitutales bacterium]
MNEIFAFLNIGNTELIIILVIILLLFGAKKLPELARGLGKSMQEFKKASREVEDNFRDAINEDEERKPAPKVESKEEKEEQK